MHIGIIGKFPPIQGGVSKRVLALATACAASEHSAAVITNAGEVGSSHRQLYLKGDREALAGLGDGDVTLTGLSQFRQDHIPASACFESRLVGCALREFEERRPDVILGWYLQPYAVAAHYVAKLLGIPLAVTHAGSDITRLANHPDLFHLHRRILEDADMVVTLKRQLLRQRLGAITERAKLTFIPCFLPQVRTGLECDLDLCELQSHAAGWLSESFGVSASSSESLTRPLASRSSAVRIGIYGKIGTKKGHYDLLEALHGLAKRGVPFELVVLMSANANEAQAFVRAIEERPPLAERVRLLPPVTPWRIPSFIRQCDIVCFLERDFSVDIHHPGVPREVLDAGGTLVVSREPIHGTMVGELVQHRRSCYIVEDPRNIEELAAGLLELIESPELRHSIANGGRVVGEALSSFFDRVATTSPMLTALEQLERNSA